MHSDGQDEDKADDAALTRAAQWRVQIGQGGLSRDQQKAFSAWLEADPANLAAWRAVDRAWGAFDAEADAPELVTARRESLSRAHGHWRRRRKAAAGALKVAAAVGFLCLSAWLYLALKAPTLYQPASGERRTVTLADGSRVSMDAATSLRVKLSPGVRSLELLDGQVRFDVAHDAHRPFRVAAAGHVVEARGTAFNVDILPTRLTVTLIEGAVVVEDQTRVKATVRLAPGDELTVGRGGPATVRNVDTRHVDAWQLGKVELNDEPLQEAVARMNRYSERKIVLGSPTLASVQISGIFNAGASDAFVEALSLYLPVEARTRNNQLVLFPRREDG